MSSKSIYKLKQHPSYYADMPHTAISKTDNKPHTPYTYLIGWSKLDKWYYGVKFAKGCHPAELFNMGVSKKRRYETSSKVVHGLILENGLPDIIQIRQIFKNSVGSINAEHTVINRLNMIKSTKFLNICNYGNTIDTSGRLAVRDLDGNTFSASVHDPRLKTGEIVAASKGYVSVKDVDGLVSRVSLADPRYLSGELISIKVGKVNVKDSSGVGFTVSTTDPRYISGELIHTSTGVKCSDETKNKIGNANSGRVQTEEHRRKNSEGNTGKIRSGSAILKTAAKNRGRKNSEDGNANIALANSKYLYDLISPSNEIFANVLKRDLFLIHGLDTQTCCVKADTGIIVLKYPSRCNKDTLNTEGWQVFKKLKPL